MAEDHPFTIGIERHIKTAASRFRWSIYESGKLRQHSPHTYATKREALADAHRVLQQFITRWQIGK
jgi:hypothetical protein